MGTGSRSGRAAIAAGALISSAACSAEPMTERGPQTAGTATVAGERAAQNYRDGTYRAEGWYGGLPSHLDVSVRLERSFIRAVTIGTPATDPTSLRYQRAFAQAVPAAVVGRRIEDVRVGRLAGSSGCPIGFNDALRRIRAQAQGTAGGAK